MMNKTLSGEEAYVNYLTRLTDLSRFSKDELCDIYYNILNFTWDKRLIGRPANFDALPDSKKTLFKRRTKEEVLEPYKKDIEALVTKKDRERYEAITLRKAMTEEEFDIFWSSITR